MCLDVQLIDNYWSLALLVLNAPGPRLNIKRVFLGMGIPMLKIRWLWERLIFIMGIPILVRQRLYIEKVPRCFVATLLPLYNSPWASTICYKEYIWFVMHVCVNWDIQAILHIWEWVLVLVLFGWTTRERVHFINLSWYKNVILFVYQFQIPILLSSMKITILWLKFHWNLFPGV